MNEALDTLNTPGTAVAALTPSAAMCAYAGVETVPAFTSPGEELVALTASCGVFDQGWRSAIRITGPDRLRWLNGMVTNTVKDLPAGHWNYTFLLDAQGRILGDAEIFARSESLLLVTDRDQVRRVYDHLDRFIIMDEVELELETETSSIGVAGPSATALADGSLPVGAFVESDGVLTARMGAERYAFRGEADEVTRLWERLLRAGAVPVGAEALESLRVLEGRPRYGVDLQQRTLAQESGQMHALSFNKGCYLGQEIVERVRSRANVHRAVRSFALEGAQPEPGAALFVDSEKTRAVGELTSSTLVSLPPLAGMYAIGTVRSEAAQAPLFYAGGTARVLDRAPLHPAEAGAAQPLKG